ncbi:KilA-like protein (plasmid) [Anabaenopsis circularis NIES-21]|uniref:KilA-like protein n=1 Tax=Anabaenopsis circularis NIES-21 TaxID=1085406 RepID=A0A1Z4GSG4_9CYAN|nr:KilA-like protein [Anabaenopsis circularis NIES-21]
MDEITFQTKDELGFCTRQNDGISGMTVTALANFCGTEQHTITQLLNKIRDSEPITNDLPKSLLSFAGKEWRLITNDPHGSLYVIDELCHAILEYYAVDARKYKGKQIALNNYRMVARAGLRVFIWSQTGYSPQTLSNEQMALLQAIPAMQQAIADLQSQIQNLLPPSADFIPPGWDAEVWRKLPSQDKRHFRFLYRRRNFRPSQENQPLALPAATVEQVKERQRAEVEQLVGEVSLEEKQQFQAAKLQKLREFWSQASVEEQKDMPF